jgi:4'-phosphopantetheinyl transferase
VTEHLWLADPLEVDAALESRTQGSLHDDDLAAEARKRLEGDRRLIRTSRWLARSAIARRAGIPAHELVLGREQTGRPFVAHPPDAADIVYSVSHTRGLIAVLEGRHRSVGVDVERVDPTVNVADLGRVVMLPAEQTALGDVAPADRVLAFFRHWVVKEAVLKALGTGFLTDPTDVHVQLVGDRAHVKLAPHALDALEVMLPPRWAITVFEAGAGHVGATALQWDGTGAAPQTSIEDWHELLHTQDKDAISGSM